MRSIVWWKEGRQQYWLLKQKLRQSVAMDGLPLPMHSSMIVQVFPGVVESCLELLFPFSLLFKLVRICLDIRQPAYAMDLANKVYRCALKQIQQTVTFLADHQALSGFGQTLSGRAYTCRASRRSFRTEPGLSGLPAGCGLASRQRERIECRYNNDNWPH